MEIKTLIPESNSLKSLAIEADKQRTLERQIADAEDVVKALKAAYNEVSQHTIPTLMQEIGISEFKLTDGSKVTVTPFYAGKITADAGYEWLRSHGHGDIVKSHFEVSYNFDVSEEELKAILEKLDDTGLVYVAKKSVHHMSLGAWLREQIEAGEDIPKDIFNVYYGFKTKIK